MTLKLKSNLYVRPVNIFPNLLHCDGIANSTGTSADTVMTTFEYCQTSNVRGISVGNKLADHSDVVGASPVSAAPTTSSFST